MYIKKHNVNTQINKSKRKKMNTISSKQQILSNKK